MPNRLATWLVAALLMGAGATALAACSGALPPATDPGPALEPPDAGPLTAVPLDPAFDEAPTPVPTRTPAPTPTPRPASPSPVPTASATAEAVYFRSHVAPILTQHCKACHVPGGAAPFPLFDAKGNASATEVRPRIASLIGAIEAGRMPKDDPGAVSADQLATLKAWEAAGMPLDPTPAGSAAPASPMPSPSPAAPTAATVSFMADVVPILQSRCASCHTVGGRGASELAMFNRAGQVQFWAIADEIHDMIEAIEDGEMPKGAPPGTVPASELAVLRAWAQAGTPDN